MPPAQSHLLRRGRFSEPGRIYLLTTITHQRRPLFSDLRYARLVIQQLRQSDIEQTCKSLAWVVMPDHLHWLIELQEVTLATLMRRLKSRTGIALRRAGVRDEPIWQPGYQDRALRREEDVRKVARYIVANPLRTGLASSVRLYPHWDAVWL
ncbi:transposase [Pseudomonas xanthosomatis]|uniref:REP-associated tyrosine transposase n=1 Tax=Pseudomonas xanthosomatis TaxID=2842356 RepID=UPI001C3DD1F0|nr:transposase [Pseudomonas xanthosomatis]QXH46509.1 transposase [Pseudomonas xanthosomatis]